jgi:hypothetical protein
MSQPVDVSAGGQPAEGLSSSRRRDPEARGLGLDLAGSLSDARRCDDGHDLALGRRHRRPASSEDLQTHDVSRATGVLDRYADLGLVLADASIVVLPGRHQTLDVLTVDERLFTAMIGPDRGDAVPRAPSRIDVGGKNTVPMERLRSLLDEPGYSNVSTYIASGNVVGSGRPEPDNGTSR